MPILTEKDYTFELILQAAKDGAAAALGAPRLTPNLELETRIVYGEEIGFMVRLLEIFAGPEGAYSQFIYGDYLMGKRFLEQNEPYAILLIGAKTSPSPLAWDCGACGFPTCGEFNRFANENKSAGMFGYGPACNWLMMDFGIALSQASAAIYAKNVDSRQQGSYGAAALILGMMPGMDAIIANSIGPLNRGVFQEWYNRPEMKGSFDMDKIYEMLIATFAYHFGAFSGDGIPMIKNTDDWFWEPFKAGHGPMPEAVEILPQILEKAGEVTLEYEQWLQEHAAGNGES